MNREFIQQHQRLIDSVCDLMVANDVPPEDGEKTLLYIAGLRCGLRGHPQMDPKLLQCLAIGWRVGAAAEGVEE